MIIAAQTIQLNFPYSRTNFHARGRVETGTFELISRYDSRIFKQWPLSYECGRRCVQYISVEGVTGGWERT